MSVDPTDDPPVPSTKAQDPPPTPPDTPASVIARMVMPGPTGELGDEAAARVVKRLQAAGFIPPDAVPDPQPQPEATAADLDEVEYDDSDDDDDDDDSIDPYSPAKPKAKSPVKKKAKR